ncbi:MAG: ATP phosphoribosyltransferase regulatory subunit, partial [Clostridia bacterium]|nr:ATP phosphoribosyltransferase regulatory subunit [Clostridia bacterium]
MKVNIQPVRGTYDYPPIQAENREIVRQKILKSYQDNGFTLIDTPVLENLSLLDSSEGGDNLRLMFKTIKRGAQLDLTKPNLTEKDITEEGLRYDLTVPLARFYAGNRENLPNPFKSIQIGYSFRAERPQKGRNRQFVQCDIDIFGDNSVNAEVDVITTVMDTYARLGLTDVTMKVNSRKILNSLVEFCGFTKEEINSVCITLDK